MLKNHILPQIIALHFAVSTPPGFGGFPIGPQFYMTCFNFMVTGSGAATPKGAKFPGAYKLEEPGFHVDVNKTMMSYPTVGPALYKSQMTVQLEPNPHTVVSPTGNATTDEAYYQRQYKVLEQQGQITSYFDSIGG